MFNYSELYKDAINKISDMQDKIDELLALIEEKDAKIEDLKDCIIDLERDSRYNERDE